MEGKNNGHIYNIGTIWNTCGDDDSVWLFYMEAEQIYSGNSDDRTRPRLQEVGRYYYKIDRPTEVSTNGTKKIKRSF